MRNLGNIDMGAAMRRVADRRIEEAMKEGKFDNLPGAGKPLDLEPMPAQEEARMTWWCLRILKQNDYTPDEIRWRKRVDQLHASLHAAKSEEQVMGFVREINQVIHQINTLGTNAMKSPMSPLDGNWELQRFRERIRDNANAAAIPRS